MLHIRYGHAMSMVRVCYGYEYGRCVGHIDTLMGLKVVNNGVSGSIRRHGRGKGHVSINWRAKSVVRREAAACQKRVKSRFLACA